MHLNCCCTLFIMIVWPKHKNIIRPYFCSHSQRKHCYENHWWPTAQNKSISNNDKAFPTGGHMLPVNSFWKWLRISSPGMTDAWSQLLLQGLTSSGRAGMFGQFDTGSCLSNSSLSICENWGPRQEEGSLTTDPPSKKKRKKRAKMRWERDMHFRAREGVEGVLFSWLQFMNVAY